MLPAAFMHGAERGINETRHGEDPVIGWPGRHQVIRLGQIDADPGVLQGLKDGWP
jgi:hypothetical protein